MEKNAEMVRAMARPDTLLSAAKIEQNCVDYWVSVLLCDCALWEAIEERDCTPRDTITGLDCVRSLILELNGMTRDLMKIVGDEEDIPEVLPSTSLLDAPRGCWGETLSSVYDTLRKELKLPAQAIPDAILNHKKRIEEKVHKEGMYDETLTKNLALLKKSFGLTDTDVAVLAILIFAKCDRRFLSVLNLLNYERRGMALRIQVIARLIGASEREVSESLGVHGHLREKGIVSRDTHFSSNDFEDVYEVFNDEGTTTYIWEPITVKWLLGNVARRVPETNLTWEHFKHLPILETVALPYLKKAVAEHMKGVNILLYGPPGTGKTELSRLFAKSLGLAAYETGEESDKKTTRLQMWKVASELLAGNGDALLAVDEAADVFNCGIEGNGQRTDKAHLIHLLETNACPTIWMTNSISSMDAALIRRFRFVLKVDVPPMQNRFEIAKASLGDYVSESTLWQMAETDRLSPAVIESIASVAENMRHAGLDVSEENLIAMIGETLKAQGVGTLAPKRSKGEVYDPTLTRSDMDLETLTRGIAEAGAARLCLYGPPGTGKTAYAHYLAKSMNRPLVARRASDLLSMWVGGTEANIAEAFEEAKLSKAVLLIDEADSFLRDRKSARVSWEVTQVNELLTQMESFEGVFIATTNLVEALDQASLRRFDLKAKFDYLNATQTGILLKKYLRAAGLSEEGDTQALMKLAALQNLTPGDFASVARQMRFAPVKSMDAFVSALLKESEVKKGQWENRRTIGFV